ncbi:MAG: hypothetical protein KJ725_10530 [Gammaproteobacteria bacterium]|uniref:hypothetical protein n=2 Tax=Methylotuvimicrobium sp. TaxID=2822413 RepID=UPI001D247C1D|nr:hypothetical protein [Gammaproteobacteria bacterium]
MGEPVFNDSYGVFIEKLISVTSFFLTVSNYWLFSTDVQWFLFLKRIQWIAVEITIMDGGVMQYKTSRCKVLLAAMGVILLSFAGLGVSSASEAVIITQANGQWSLAGWYGFSVILALIGFIAAKSKN